MPEIPETTTQEYVEIIHEIQKTKKVARVKDIAKHRGVTRSSVSNALNFLKKRDLIVHEQYGLVELTEKGEELGEHLARRHQALLSLLADVLNVPMDVAEQDACKLEHHISPITFACIINFLEQVKVQKNV